jgi:hypothetical protein
MKFDKKGPCYTWELVADLSALTTAAACSALSTLATDGSLFFLTGAFPAFITAAGFVWMTGLNCAERFYMNKF